MVRCPKCARVFDPLAALHPPPAPAPPEVAPRGLTVTRSGQTLRATLLWLDVWALKRWPAATVTLLHFVLMAIGAYFGAWGGVLLLGVAVAIQLWLYARVLGQKTTLVATPGDLRVERVRQRGDSFPRAALTDLFVVEVAPRALRGKPLEPRKKRTRMYALCALAPDPVCLIHGLPTLAHAQVLEDAARVALALPQTRVDGAIRRA